MASPLAPDRACGQLPACPNMGWKPSSICASSSGRRAFSPASSRPGVCDDNHGNSGDGSFVFHMPVSMERSLLSMPDVSTRGVSAFRLVWQRCVEIPLSVGQGARCIAGYRSFLAYASVCPSALDISGQQSACSATVASIREESCRRGHPGRCWSRRSLDTPGIMLLMGDPAAEHSTVLLGRGAFPVRAFRRVRTNTRPQQLFSCRTRAPARSIGTHRLPGRPMRRMSADSSCGCA